MKRILFFVFIFLGIFSYAQQLVSGKVLDEEGHPVSGIQVLNLTSNQAAVSNLSGEYSISANVGDQVVFVSKQYQRYNLTVSAQNYSQFLLVKLLPFTREIEGVRILSKSDIDRMKQNVGVPGPPEKPREKVPERLGDVLAIGIPPAIAVNIDALYKMISGDARRMKNLYKYEDRQDRLQTVVNQLGLAFFRDNNIPAGKEKEFVQYVMGKEEIQTMIRDRNFTGVEFALMRNAPDFVKSLEKTKG